MSFFLQKNLCCCFSQLPTCICLEPSPYWSLCIICCSLSTCWQHNQVTKGNPQDYSWRNVRNRLGPFLVTSLKKKKIEKIRQGHYLKCIANLLLTLTLDQKQFVIKKNIAAPLVLLQYWPLCTGCQINNLISPQICSPFFCLFLLWRLKRSQLIRAVLGKMDSYFTIAHVMHSCLLSQICGIIKWPGLQLLTAMYCAHADTETERTALLAQHCVSFLHCCFWSSEFYVPVLYYWMRLFLIVQFDVLVL